MMKPQSPEQPSLTNELVEGRLPLLQRFCIGGIVSRMRSLARRVIQRVPASEIDEIESPADVMEEVVEQTEDSMRRNTLKVLRESKPRWSQDNRIAVADAVDFGDFGDIENDTPELKMAALSLRMVNERVRSGEGFKRLQSLDQEQLDAMGMSQEMRRLLVGEQGDKEETEWEERRGLLQKLRAVDMEYLRQHARALHGEDLKQWSHDAVRPRRRLFNAFHTFANAIEESEALTEFQDVLTKQRFVACMRSIAEGYKTHTERKPVSKTSQFDAAKKANTELNRFYAAHPEFPLTIVPPGYEYLSEELGKDLGYDAGVMVAWRDKRDVKQEETLRELKTPLAETLLELFPDEISPRHLRDLREAMVYVRSDLTSFGVGRTMRSYVEDHGVKGVLLLKNIQEGEETEPVRDILKSLLPAKHHAIVDAADFAELVRTFTALHGFMNTVFPSEGKAGKNLGTVDEELSETKADSVAMAVFSKLYNERAKELFVNNAQIAMNLALMGAMTNALSWSNADSETSPFYTSAVYAHELFVEAGLFTMRDGKVMIDVKKLSEIDVSEIVRPLAKSMLKTYRSAEDNEGNARRSAKKLMGIKPSKMVKLLKDQL